MGLDNSQYLPQCLHQRTHSTSNYRDGCWGNRQSQLSDSVELLANSKSFRLLKPLKGRVRSLAINPAHCWVVTGHCHHSSAFEGKLEPVKKGCLSYHFLFFLGRLNKSIPRWELLDFVLSSNNDCWKWCVAVGGVFLWFMQEVQPPEILSIPRLSPPTYSTNSGCTLNFSSLRRHRKAPAPSFLAFCFSLEFNKS